MAKALLLVFVLTICIAVVISQCFIENDKSLNERNIGLASDNLLEGSTEFSLALLRTLNEEENSNEDSRGVLFSPYSIWSSLFITYMGARGFTEQELRNVLSINDTDKAATWDAFRNIHSSLPYALNKSNVSSYIDANRIYFQDGMVFKSCMRENLYNEIEFVDFKDNPDNTRELINTWVEKQTQNKIKEFIPIGGINSLTNMMIVNAVYFREAWLQTFERKQTSRRRFITASGKNMNVTMMYRKGRFMYGYNEELGCNALELPYVGKVVSMIILLPESRYKGINNLTEKLTPKRLRNLFDDMYIRQFTVMIPKFKFEGSYELSSVLSKMGLRTLFDRRRVDLSGFTGSSEFTVDSVHHKTFIDVNEEGTEASAATRFRFSKKGASFFVADSPFVYVIRDNISGAILFLGTFQKPSDFDSS